MTLGVTLTGCASIISGKKQVVSFNSVPAGAVVEIDGKQVGTTPFAVKLNRKRNQILSLAKPGYNKYTKPLNTTINVATLGNILCGGPFGTSTDASTGALIEYAPNEYNVTLVREDHSPLEVYPGMTDKEKTKTFILASYRSLKNDLERSEGEYLTSLLSYLRVSNSDKELAIRKIRALGEVYTDIPTFADAVVGLYLK
jgi:hypothetical protein